MRIQFFTNFIFNTRIIFKEFSATSQHIGAFVGRVMLTCCDIGDLIVMTSEWVQWVITLDKQWRPKLLGESKSQLVKIIVLG